MTAEVEDVEDQGPAAAVGVHVAGDREGLPSALAVRVDRVGAGDRVRVEGEDLVAGRDDRALVGDAAPLKTVAVRPAGLVQPALVAGVAAAVDVRLCAADDPVATARRRA